MKPGGNFWQNLGDAIKYARSTSTLDGGGAYYVTSQAKEDLREQGKEDEAKQIEKAETVGTVGGAIAGLTLGKGVPALMRGVKAFRAAHPIISGAIDTGLTVDGVRNALSDNGVEKTINYIKDGNWGRAAASGTMDALDLLGGVGLAGDAVKGVSKVADLGLTKYLNKNISSEDIYQSLSQGIDFLNPKTTNAFEAWQEFWKSLPANRHGIPDGAWHIDHVDNHTIKTGLLSDPRFKQGTGITWWDIHPSTSSRIGSHPVTKDNIVINIPTNHPSYKKIYDSETDVWWNYRRASKNLPIQNANMYAFTGEKWIPITSENKHIFLKKSGGSIKIKKKNRGKFTDYCGGKVTEECIRKGQNSSNPTTRKRANFAWVARHKFKHQDGGATNYLNLFN